MYFKVEFCLSGFSRDIYSRYKIMFAYKKIRKILNLQILFWKSQDTLNKAIVVSTDSIYHPIELKKNCPL